MSAFFCFSGTPLPLSRADVLYVWPLFAPYRAGDNSCRTEKNTGNENRCRFSTNELEQHYGRMATYLLRLLQALDPSNPYCTSQRSPDKDGNVGSRST